MGFPTKIREQVHQKYGGRCAYCGHEITQRKMQVDHLWPKVDGGTDDFENLNPSCRYCNNYKLFWSLQQFRAKLADQVRLGRDHSVNFRLAERYEQIAITPKPIVFYFETVTAHDEHK